MLTMRYPQVERRSRRYAARQFVSDFESQPESGGGVVMSNGNGEGVATERSRGTVKFFNNEKGFGFCKRDSGPDVFIHANALKRSGIEGGISPGDLLEFDVVPVDGKGPKAAAISVIAKANTK